MQTVPISRIEAEVLRVRALMQAERYQEALGAAQALLAEVPENRDVLYMIAVSQRYLRRPAEALATLARLEAAHPAYSRLFQERGHCFAALGNPAAALTAYLQAVSINPALPASWNAASILFRAAGRAGEAQTAASHVAKLKNLPGAVVAATSMFADGETYEAERLIREFLKTHPNDVEAMRLLARIGLKLEVLDACWRLRPTTIWRASITCGCCCSGTVTQRRWNRRKSCYARNRKTGIFGRFMQPPASPWRITMRHCASIANWPRKRRRHQTCISPSGMR
jgi:tetratricopeptide (TPR) repeat protein